MADLTRHVEVRQPPLAAQSVRAAAVQRELVEVAALAADQDDRLDAAATLAMMAEERVAEAERMARAAPSYDVVFAIDEVKFDPESAALTSGSRALLDQLAERLLMKGVGRYIEVHGHADRAADQAGSTELARDRAEAIRRYLHVRHGLPLFRIAAVASREIAGEATAQGGAGRAVVVVLRQAREPGSDG